jgi:hypothetical protein
MRNVSDKSCRENQNNHFVFSNFKKKYITVFEIMWQSLVEGCRPQVTIWRMYIAFWIHKATDTHSGHLIFTAFTQQQLLRERASMLRYTNFACLVTK